MGIRRRFVSEVEIGGDLWCELSCGHLIRTQTAIVNLDNCPAELQECDRCRSNQTDDRPRPRRPSFGGTETRRDMLGAQPRPKDGDTRTVRGRREYYWRKRWRPL